MSKCKELSDDDKNKLMQEDIYPCIKHKYLAYFYTDLENDEIKFSNLTEEDKLNIDLALLDIQTDIKI